MSKTVNISSPTQFNDVLKASRLVVADCKLALLRVPRPLPVTLLPRHVVVVAVVMVVAPCVDLEASDITGTLSWSLANLPSPVYADWCGPCQQVAPLFEQLSQTLSRPNLVTFVKVNTDQQKDVAQAYRVTSLPTFIIFRNAKVADRVQGADPIKLQSIVKKLSEEVENLGSGGEASGSSGGNGGSWRGADLPRGYTDITDQIELQRCELLNVDPGAGGVRVLFDTTKPSALSGGKTTTKDWVESDTDEQLLLFMPFQSVLKLHTLQVRHGRQAPSHVTNSHLTLSSRSRPYLQATTTTTTRRRPP